MKSAHCFDAFRYSRFTQIKTFANQITHRYVLMMRNLRVVLSPYEAGFTDKVPSLLLHDWKPSTLLSLTCQFFQHEPRDYNGNSPSQYNKSDTGRCDSDAKHVQGSHAHHVDNQLFNIPACYGWVTSVGWKKMTMGRKIELQKCGTAAVLKFCCGEPWV